MLTSESMEEIEVRLRSAANEVIEMANSIAVRYQCIRANRIYTVYREPCTIVQYFIFNEMHKNRY